MLCTVLFFKEAAADSWVLWERQSTVTDDTAPKIWIIHEAFETLSDCSVAKKKYVNSEAKTWETLKSIGKIESFVKGEDSVSVVALKTLKIDLYKYFCLPNPLDPRSK